MFKKITESPSPYHDLEKMPVEEILRHINEEDKTVPNSVGKAIFQIRDLVTAIGDRMLGGGRLFYIGAGTSGRLGIVDASECPPTFGVSYDLVVGLIAGGDLAIRKSVEFAEDDRDQGWKDLMRYNITTKDSVVGIAASGTTPYVIGTLKECQSSGILTGCVTCNPGSPITLYSDFPVVVTVGPEVLTGSTRMKSGTAQKLVLNMISTTVMIKLGRVKDNKMVNMQLSNEKLIDRGTRMIMEETGSKEYERTKTLLIEYGSIKKVIAIIKEGDNN